MMSKKSPRLLVEITQEHIDTSIPRDSGHCMIADAIHAVVPDATFIAVDLQTIRFSDPATGLRHIYLTPRRGQEALVKWDQGIKPQPFSFQLRGGQVRAMNRGRNSGSRKVRLVTPRDGSGGSVPEVHGGPLPPTAALASGPRVPKGRRRAFGLRGLTL